MKHILERKDNLLVIVFNILVITLLLIFIRTHTDFFAIVYTCLFVTFLILIHVYTSKDYISKFAITFHTLFVLLSAIIVIGLIALKIYPLLDGWQGVNSAIILMLFFLIQSTLIGIMLLSNFIKFKKLKG